MTIWRDLQLKLATTQLTIRIKNTNKTFSHKDLLGRDLGEYGICPPVNFV